jgi:hypothetical protein
VVVVAPPLCHHWWSLDLGTILTDRCRSVAKSDANSCDGAVRQLCLRLSFFFATPTPWTAYSYAAMHHGLTSDYPCVFSFVQLFIIHLFSLQEFRQIDK